MSEATSTRELVSEFAWVAVLGGARRGGRPCGAPRGRPRRRRGGRLDALLRAPAPEREAQVAALLAESVRSCRCRRRSTSTSRPSPSVTFAARMRSGRSGRCATVRRPRRRSCASARPVARSCARRKAGRSRPRGRWSSSERPAASSRARVQLSDARTFNGPPPSVESVLYQAHIRFAEEPRLGFAVPSVMEDRYEWRLHASENRNLSIT